MSSTVEPLMRMRQCRIYVERGKEGDGGSHLITIVMIAADGKDNTPSSLEEFALSGIIHHAVSGVGRSASRTKTCQILVEARRSGEVLTKITSTLCRFGPAPEICDK